MLQIAKLYATILRLVPKTNLIYFTVSESTFGNLKDLIVYLLCWARLKRMTIHLHGGAGMRVILSGKHPVLRTLNRFFLKRVGAVVVLGERLRGIYVGIVPSERLHAVPNFAGDEFFVDEATVESKFSRVDPLRLLFLSNLLPGKGHEELLAALALLPVELRGRLQVDFAGGFESRDAELTFQQVVQHTEGVMINVHGVVRGELKKELLRKAHLFCLPTYYPYEGQPISILEAYASGCAVMTTDHSGIFDTFTPGVNGVEVQPKSPESITNAVVWALDNTAQLHEYGRSNLRDALSKYRVSTHVKALEEVILSVQG